ncbi:MAG: UTP--glucose-1-phosphate uridylyltransferase GalU [Alphaproteobacteria bacterium]|nr:UTP--glucose-1-phosphate uridylyltransferase GalU [Alphaproteobacteria bacterium]MBV8547904.1 UTP--glucose-1-phosphate uridylyltransferase GalU [Alphaproteobacteria bacterium]
MSKLPIRKAVFPVAGLGTRFLPATKAMPKEMLTLVDRPLIQHAVDEARAAGIEQFIFVTSRGKSALEDHFDNNNDLKRTLEARNKVRELELLKTTDIDSGQLLFTRQREPLGLGHAIWCARHLVGNEPFAILLADDVVLAQKPCLKQMIEAYNDVGGNLVAVTEVPREHTNRYGILDIEKDDGRMVSVKGLFEKPQPELAPSTLSIIGRYILQPEIFTYLEEKRAGAGGEIQLTDSMVKLIGKQAFHGLRYEGTRYDCGDKVGFIEATAAFALAHPEMGGQVREALKKIIAKA